MSNLFDTYWYFAAERQKIFFKRLKGEPQPWTDDPILQKYKFTNVYRATDRVSQYLTRNIIYSSKYNEQDLFFRILLFKLFNRISTWESLQENLGEITYRNFKFEKYDKILIQLLKNNQKIFSAAYIMPMSKQSTLRYKHQVLLKLLEAMMKNNLSLKISKARSLKEVFNLLKSYPLIGNFLAYQYAIDINYSPLTNFSENEFVVAGPGAARGIKKCFPTAHTHNFPTIIRDCVKNQEKEFAKHGLKFQNLFGRPLKLIDCQGLFCELDKYSRAFGKKSNKRIKQNFKMNPNKINYFFPPKWNISSTLK